MKRIFEIKIDINKGITYKEEPFFTQSDSGTHFLRIIFKDPIDFTNKSMKVNFIKPNKEVVYEMIPFISGNNIIKVPNNAIDIIGSILIEIVLIEGENILTTNKLAVINVVETSAGANLTMVPGNNFQLELNKLVEELARILREAKNELNEKSQEKKEELNQYTEARKEDLEDYTNNKKEDLNNYNQIKKEDLEDYTNDKKKDLDNKIIEKKEEVKIYVETKKDEIDEYIEENKKNLKGEKGEQGIQGEQGVKGEKGDSNTLIIGNVQKGEIAAAEIKGESPNQILNLTLPKGDKGDKGFKGNGIKKTEYLGEDESFIYYKFIYDDDSEFKWKCPMQIVGQGNIEPGSIIETFSRASETPENWLSLENYRTIKIDEYPEMAERFPVTTTKWKRLNPKISSGTGDDEFKVHMAYFEITNEIIKHEMDALPLIDAVNGGEEKINYVQFPFAANQPQEQGARVFPLHIWFSGSLVREARARNQKILCIFHVTFTGYDRSMQNENNMIWNNMDITCGESLTFLEEEYKLAQALHSCWKQPTHLDYQGFYEAQGVQYNQMAFTIDYLPTYMNGGDSPDPNHIGIAFDALTNNFTGMYVHKIELWEQTRTEENVLDIPPYIFVPYTINFTKWSNNFSGDMGNSKELYPIEYHLKKQIYLGKKKIG